MKKSHFLLLLALVLVLLTGCAPTVVELSACSTGEPAGFWLGLWHGFIVPFTFIVSLFNEEVAVYAVCNNGGWYDFGFLMGASIIFGGSGNRARPPRRRRDG